MQTAFHRYIFETMWIAKLAWHGDRVRYASTTSTNKGTLSSGESVVHYKVYRTISRSTSDAIHFHRSVNSALNLYHQYRGQRMKRDHTTLTVPFSARPNRLFAVSSTCGERELALAVRPQVGTCRQVGVVFVARPRCG